MPDDARVGRASAGGLKTAAELKALADPTRIRLLLECVDEPRTVKELAAILGVPQTRLYYHVGILEQHGILRVAGRRMVSGIEERSYLAVGQDWTISAGLPATSGDMATVTAALLGAVGAELQVALHNEPDTRVGEPDSVLPVIMLTPLSLTPAEVERFAELLSGVLEQFESEGRDDSPDRHDYHLLVAGYRKPRSSKSGHAAVGSSRNKPETRR